MSDVRTGHHTVNGSDESGTSPSRVSSLRVLVARWVSAGYGAAGTIKGWPQNHEVPPQLSILIASAVL